MDNITGIYPLQEQLEELAAAGATDTYDYERYSLQLETELAAGEPEFQNVALWESLFGVWGGIMAVILLSWGYLKTTSEALTFCKIQPFAVLYAILESSACSALYGPATAFANSLYVL